MNCKVCNFKNKKIIATIKSLPISNFLFKKKMKKNIDLDFFVCRKCGLIQNSHSPNSKGIIGNQKNFKQKEPEDHLDDVVNKIIKLRKLKKKSKIISLTYKDHSLLLRFKKQGFKNVDTFNFKDKFENKKFENLDCIIEQKKYVVPKKYESSNLVISRHFLEHNFSLKNFFDLINKFYKKIDEKYILIEVPDTLKSLKNNDFACIWEQHKIYFTSNSLENCMKLFGFEKIFLDCKKYPYENCLIYFGKKVVSQKKISNIKKIKIEKIITKQFFLNLFKFRSKIFNYFKSLKNKKIALYGVGHQGIFFINFFKLKNFFRFTFDDNDNLHNNYLPGTDIIIKKPSNKLKNFDYIFLSANHSAEVKISKKNSFLLKKKGKFLSLSFNNKNGIRKYV
jgi:hypothetical protein